MINQRILESAKDISDLAKVYEGKADTANGELKEEYSQFVSKLDELHSKILGLGKFAEQEELNIDGVVTKSFDNLPSYSQINILYKYEDHKALVLDTSNELHLIPLEFIKVAD